MKKITTFLFTLTFMGAAAFGQVHLDENFGSGTFPPAGWMALDQDGNTMNAAGAGLNTTVDGSWQGRFQIFAALGVSATSSSAYTTGSGSSDDWLITSQVTLPAAVAGRTSVLSFIDGHLVWNAPYNTAPTLEVRVSTTGNAVADFTDILTVSSASIGTDVNLKTVDLSAYAGMSIYIAFRDVSTNTRIYWLDEITVETIDNVAIAMNTVVVPELAVDQESVTITGTVVNTGANNLTSFDVSWEDGSGTPNVMNVTGVNIPLNGIGQFSHTTALTASNPGNFTNLTVTASNPNGSADGDDSDNSEMASVFVNNGNGISRNVLVEEHSDAECPFCPDGAVAVKRIKEDYPNAIVVQHHGGYQFNDNMTLSEISEYEQFPMGGLPAIIMDRDIINPAGAREVAWVNGVGEAEGNDAFVELSIKGSLEKVGSRDLVNLDIDVDFKDYVVPGDIRLTIFVVEDTLVNNATVGGYDRGWDQLNAYYLRQGSENHPYYNVGTPRTGATAYIDGYEHLDVVRDVWPSSDAWGDNQTVTKNAPAPGDQFSRSMDFVVEDAWDMNQLSVVAFLSYYDASDVLQRKILNAEKANVTDFWYVGIDENASSVANLEVFPNPSSSITNLNLSLVKNEDVELRLFDITGKELRYEDFGTMNAGRRNIELNVSDLANGFYFVNLRVGDETVSRKISVNR